MLLQNQKLIVLLRDLQIQFYAFSLWVTSYVPSELRALHNQEMRYFNSAFSGLLLQLGNDLPLHVCPLKFYFFFHNGWNEEGLFANDNLGSLLHNWNWIIEKLVFQRKKALKMVTHAIDIFQSTTKIKLVRQSNETTSHLEHQIRIWKKMIQRCFVNLDPHDLSLVVTLLLR